SHYDSEHSEKVIERPLSTKEGEGTMLSSAQRCPCIRHSREAVGELVVCWSSHALLLPAAGNERCFGMM
ncbi:eIF-2-alpha kinase activator GCN1, partial [Dissostichus eleginoides]